MTSHPTPFAHRLPAWLLIVLGLLGALLAPTARAAEEFLEPEKAFRFSARAADERHVEVLFQITPGYYMYREQIRASSPDASVGALSLPAGKVKFDETFQKNVETYRGQLRFNVPVDKAPATFTLNVVSQGCADAGLCYPPMTSTAKVSLVAFGGNGSVQVVAADAGSVAVPTATMAAGSAAGGARSWLDGSGVDSVLKSGQFWLVVGAFFVMGVALSFTPCVLPMLPILSSIIAGAAAPVSRGRALALAATYSLGMALGSASPPAWQAKAWPRGCSHRRCSRCSRWPCRPSRCRCSTSTSCACPRRWPPASPPIPSACRPGSWPVCSAWVLCPR
jgi:thiol:disulfide interchange protein DsbD